MLYFSPLKYAHRSKCYTFEENILYYPWFILSMPKDMFVPAEGGTFVPVIGGTFKPFDKYRKLAKIDLRFIV